MKPTDKFIIQGLGGEKTLKGTVAINGAKNAVLKAMAGAILFDGPVTLENVPDTDDVHTQSEIITKLGGKVTHDATKKTLTIDSSGINSTDIDVPLAQNMRASVVLTGPLLARYGSASFSSPGGCVLGTRPIDLFIEGYKKMGAVAELDGDMCKMKVNGKLGDSEIFFNIQTVGGTETLMMAGVLSSGTTVLKNCAMEPEIQSIAEWLNSNGANIIGAGTTTITIKGTAGKLLSLKNSYVTLPDRIEAGSYLILGALCADELKITNCRPDHMEAVINLLKNSGVPMEVGEDNIQIKNNGQISNSKFQSFNVRTHEYPGFPTDIQAPIVTYLTQLSGESTVVETIFDGRFRYVEDLVGMGAKISINNPREISVSGAAELKALENKELKAHDIRAGFAIVLAGLLGKGESTVNNVHLIDRGYEKLEERLTKLGAEIKRVSN